MKKPGIIILLLGGGVLGFGTHLLWHASVGRDLFSWGPHMLQGIVFTLSGVVVGAVFHLVLSKT